MRVLISSVLTVSLALLGPAPVMSTAHAAQREDSSRNTILQARLRTLALAIDFANEAPDAAESRLQQALESLHPLAPEIARSAKARKEQRKGGLVLARTQLITQQIQAARLTLQDLYSIDPPSDREVMSLGPSLTKLAHEVRTELQSKPTGEIKVECARTCAAYINERRVSLASTLPAGDYRLVVQDLAGDSPLLEKRVQLRGKEASAVVRFDNSTSALMTPPGAAAGATDGAAPGQSGRYRRIAPLWLEVTGIAVGAGLAGAGAFLIHKGNEPCKIPGPGGVGCSKDLDRKTPGTVMVVAGGTLILTSTVLLIIDQVSMSKHNNGPGKLSRREQIRQQRKSGLLRGIVRF